MKGISYSNKSAKVLPSECGVGPLCHFYPPLSPLGTREEGSCVDTQPKCAHTGLTPNLWSLQLEGSKKSCLS